VTATPTAGGMSSCWYTLNGGITNYTMVNISSEYTLINSSITPGSYTSVFYCNNTANSIETTSSTFTRVCAFAGITEDALHNRVPNSKVYMINQNTNNLYNTTSNNSGDWTWNVSIGGNYTVVGIDITNSSRDADADPFILCS
jgi:hypothetical protein